MKDCCFDELNVNSTVFRENLHSKSKNGIFSRRLVFLAENWHFWSKMSLIRSKLIIFTKKMAFSIRKRDILVQNRYFHRKKMAFSMNHVTKLYTRTVLLPSPHKWHILNVLVCIQKIVYCPSSTTEHDLHSNPRI